jgi:serine/threonine-protein phosphatase PGAM5
MAKRTLVLIRHGQYTARTLRGGAVDGQLTDLGLRQATAIAERLSTRPAEHLTFSSLIRSRQTASVIAEHMPRVPRLASHLLRECLPELPYESDDIPVPALPLIFRTAERTAGISQMERAAQRYLKASKEPRTEIIVTHGNVIRELARRVVGAPAGAWLHMDVAHCSVTEISIGGNLGTMLLSLNDTGHLKPALRTY